MDDEPLDHPYHAPDPERTESILRFSIQRIMAVVFLYAVLFSLLSASQAHPTVYIAAFCFCTAAGIVPSSRSANTELRRRATIGALYAVTFAGAYAANVLMPYPNVFLGIFGAVMSSPFTVPCGICAAWIVAMVVAGTFHVVDRWQSRSPRPSILLWKMVSSEPEKHFRVPKDESETTKRLRQRVVKVLQCVLFIVYFVAVCVYGWLFV